MGTSVTRPFWATLIAALVLLAAGVPGVASADESYCAQTGSESVASDSDRYPMGAVVRITGSGYASGCDVVVRVTRPDGSVVKGDGTETPGVDLVTADGNGEIAYDYTLTDVGGDYTVEVLGADGQVLAATAFVDAATLPTLRLGTAAGPETYLFGAGQTIAASGTVDAAKYWKYVITDPSGAVYAQTACTGPASVNSTPAPLAWTVPAGAPVSTAAPWKAELQQHASVTCTDPSLSGSNTASLFFNVVRATAYASTDPTTPRTAFRTGETAQVRVEGVGTGGAANTTATSTNDFDVRWIKPGETSATATCKNTGQNDRPDSTSGVLAFGSFLQYAPAGAPAAAWNLLANHDAGATCPAFGATNQGNWTLRLDKTVSGRPNFVEIPVFRVDDTAPGTTIDLGPSGTISTASATFEFSSNESPVTFQCKLDGPGTTTGTYATCPTPKEYTSLADGAYTLSVKAVDAAGNEDPTPATRSFTVATQQAQTISFAAPSGVVYGDADFDPAATASSGLAVGYSSSTPAVCTVVAGNVHVVAAGDCTVTATQAGNSSFLAAPGVTRTFAIAKKQLTVTAADKSKTYGDGDPSFTFAYDGFVLGDDADDLDTEPSCEVAAAHSHPGEYDISCSGGADGNYSFSYVDGTLTVDQRELTVTPANQEKTYGEDDPEFAFTYDGFAAGDDAEDLGTKPTCTVDEDHSDAGEYAITCSGGDDQDYSFEYDSGTLTVAREQLTVTAADKSKIYGDGDPSFTFAYDGFVPGDDADDLDTAPSCDVDGPHSEVDTYVISCSGGADDN